MMNFSIIVSSKESGLRVDLFLVRHRKEESRAAIQKWIEDGTVLVNGHCIKASHRVQAGDRIDVKMPEKPRPDFSLLPWRYPLEILYEDEAILAINKPAGMVTHPGAGNREHTLANAVVSVKPEIKSVGHPARPGIVHRLDKETSGLLLLAKTDLCYQKLSRMFKERKIEKHYRALAYGAFRQKEGRIEKPLGRDPWDRKKISTRARRSREALTLYRVLRQYDFAALLDIHLLTGRTHQIRVHLSSEGHPIVGDSRYGGGNWNRVPDPHLRRDLKEAQFFGLHAFSLDLLHPIRGVSLHLEAPLPGIWKRLP